MRRRSTTSSCGRPGATSRAPSASRSRHDVLLARQIGQLTWRSTMRIVRQPAYVIGPLGFPLALFAVNSAGLDASTRLPGFPTESFLAFALAVPFVQGALISTL